MRIIDKNKDFYDYLQNVYPDRSVTFDRTSSYVLTKEIMCESLQKIRNENDKYQFFLLQVCNSFWLFLITITNVADPQIYGAPGTPVDYDIELLSWWKDYNKKRELIRASLVSFWNVCFDLRFRNKGRFDREIILKNASIFVQAINNNNYGTYGHLNKHVVFNGNGTRAVKTIPLFKASGVAEYINPIELFLSLEEYFSLEKQSTERTESVGITDREKIENHGFDIKTSFRGK